MILVDGQKINEQKSMSGAPLLIDPATVERIEVVKGAGSVLYGSEAIGGVVNIITKKGGEKPFGAIVSGAYNSSTSGYEGSLSAYGNTGGFHYRLTGSYSDQGDRETPSGTLEGSDSEMKSVSGVLGYINDNLDTGLLLESYEIEADVPSIMLMGRILDLDLPEWSREKVGVYSDFQDISDFLTKVHVDAYYQKTFKDFRQFRGAPMGHGGHGGPGGGGGHGKPAGTNMHTDNDQDTYAFNAQVDMSPLASHYVITGIEYSYDDLDAVTTITPAPPFAPPRFTQEANVTTWALYLQDEWSVVDELTLTLGVRETWVDSELSESNDPRMRTGSISDSHPAFSAGLTWSPSNDLAVRALFSQGYRFPDIVKLFIGTSHGGEMTLPNQDLDPETSNNFETGVRFDNDHLKADLSLFYNLAENYINRKSVGPGVSKFDNVDNATTYGMEMWLGYRFDPFNLMPYVNGTLMRREYEDDMFSTWDTNTPLFSGRVGLRFEEPLASTQMKLWGDLYMRAASDAEEELNFGGFTVSSTKDGWTTLNLAMGLNWGENDKWQASVNFNNIFDESYTTAQNSLEEPGMHVIARLSLAF
ncbi:MAG: hypothetical protein CSB23_02805 [Deltaproteobacteria bacterium]|nr:MAG: hypothetical protein CSB23_02805 [Deltaproteobacteria bacterium]